MTKERDILFESGDYWVANYRIGYTVMHNIGTHSISDSTYAKTADGLSIAKARVYYLNHKTMKGFSND